MRIWPRICTYHRTIGKVGVMNGRICGTNGKKGVWVCPRPKGCCVGSGSPLEPVSTKPRGRIGVGGVIRTDYVILFIVLGSGIIINKKNATLKRMWRFLEFFRYSNKVDSFSLNHFFEYLIRQYLALQMAKWVSCYLITIKSCVNSCPFSNAILTL